MLIRSINISYFILLLIGCYGYSQNIDSLYLADRDLQYNYASISKLQSKNTGSRNVANFIYIEQIGNYNQINSTTRSTKSNINLFQNGNYNTIDLNIHAFEIDEFVLQRGNHNNFTDLSTHWTKFHSGAVIQYGNEQNLIWFGDNSISEKIRIKMTGTDNTMIIRNYNSP